MRILNTKQIRAVDAYTIEHEPIASIDLMERASRAFAEWFTLRIETTKKIGIVCGTGNNGGDGLAISRMLDEWGYNVRLWVIRGGVPESKDFKLNYGRLPDSIVKYEVDSEIYPLDFNECDVLVDAIFGSGLSREPEGLYAYVITRVNESQALRIAVDIPSGLMADADSSGAIVKAHYTLSFQLPKLAFFLPQSYSYTGEWVLLDIGLDKKFIKDASSPFFYTQMKDVRKMIKGRSKYDHKGTFGHALLVAGSYGKMGAAVLASRAAMRAGVGLLTVHVPACGYEILQTAVPEAMVQVDNDNRVFTDAGDSERYHAIGTGPGLGQDKQTVTALSRLMEMFNKPMVLDADALNILAANPSLLHLIPAGSILTPHPREFERLTGPWKNDFERLEMQRQLASSLRSIVVLKGAHTSVASENGLVYFNSTGNPGMATAGTGDVLTGVVTGLLAQDYTPVEAAVIGVLLHGFSGDLAVETCGIDSLVASDVVKFLSAAFIKVRGK